MKPILPALIEKYIYSLLPKRDAVLMEMELLAKRERIPIIGPAVGRLLFLIASLSGAKRIFEMGSAIGYSTIWLARAAGPGARVYYTDGNLANERRARAFVKRAGVGERVVFLVGDALQLIDRVPGKFDLIFIDVNKPQYPGALRKALPRLRRRGLLVTDNTLWSGKVASGERDAATRAIRAFNQRVYSSRDLFPVLVPLRDGVTICLKS